jgi:hypothetical protein
MKWVPFTVHIRITPDWGSGELKSKRFEMWRDMQKLSTMAYEGLIDESTIQVATPGGGQQTSASGFRAGGTGGMTAGTATKPQIGESPAQLMITGFYQSSAQNVQPHPERTLIHAGEVVSGPGQHAAESNPTSTTATEVAALKTTLENVLDAAFPAGISYQIFRLDYSGIVWGDRGYHFP